MPSDVPTPPYTDNEDTLVKSKHSRLKTMTEKGKDIAGFLGMVGRFLFYAFVIISFFGIVGSFLGVDTGASATTLYGTGPEKIAVVPIDGYILEASASSLSAFQQQTVTPRGIMRILQSIEKDPTVKAVVLHVNSPGGSVTASDEIYQLITRFKARTQLPVYVSMSEVAASGGYYVSLAGDTITADSTTITGSIGVLSSTIYNYSELANNYGVTGVTVASGKNKAFLDPLAPVKDEQVAILQSIVDETYDQFVSRIKENRPKVTDDTLTQLADGRPLGSKQAQEAGFIDSVADFYSVIETVRSDIKASDAKVVEYSNGSVLGSLLGAVSSSFSKASLFEELFPLPVFQGTLMYLYLP